MSDLLHIIPAAVVAVIVIGAIVMVRKRKEGKDIPIPSAPQRTDLYYGYYGNYGDQIPEVAEHTNLLWELLWNGPDGAVTAMQRSGKATVLDVDKCMFGGVSGKQYVYPDARIRLRNLFDLLRGANVLNQVIVIVPKDEPNLPKNNVNDLIPEAVALLRSTMLEYPELSATKVGVVFAGNKEMPHKELFDVLGLDDYDARSSIFEPNGQYDKLCESLRPNQKTWILPGGTYHQDPVPFLNFANSHPEVMAIIPFIWADIPWESFPGIRSIPEVKNSYILAGKQVVTAFRG